MNGHVLTDREVLERRIWNDARNVRDVGPLSDHMLKCRVIAACALRLLQARQDDPTGEGKLIYRAEWNLRAAINNLNGAEP